MTVEALLTRLRDLDVKLFVEGDRLHLSVPNEVLTSELRDELAQRKSEILAYLQQVGTVTSSSTPRLRSVARDVNLRLSFAQERFWFLHQLTPHSPVYSIPFGLRLAEKINVAALEKSLNEIVRRHESLRTTFIAIDGQPFQRISDPEPFTLRVIDLRNLSEAEREAETKRLTEGEAQQPFDLEQGPLFRAKLLRLGDREYLLFITLHHMVFDLWSLEVFTRELAALYRAFSAGQPSPLPEIVIQYADFACWQREWLQGESLERQLSYWKQQLGGSLPLLALPTDHPRPATQSYRGAIQTFALPASLVKSIEALSWRENVTLFMTLLASFKVLLHRYTGQSDILVGTPVANRNRVEIEKLIGFFANTLVLRTDLSGDPSFRELLGRVREVALGAFAHQDVPFELLVEALNPKRETSYSPLFQVMFVFEKTNLNPLEVNTGTSKHDLTLFAWEKEDQLAGMVEYSTDLFERTTISRLLGHWQTLLDSIVANPDQRLADLTLLTGAEQHQLLTEWNATQAEYPRELCIHRLVEAQVERTPDAVAVVFQDQQLTYRELNRRANQLAHHLRKLGVGPEVLVGICVERSLEMVVGLLGILKAGGGYIPMDPAYPIERLAFMLQDARMVVILTQRSLVSKLPVNVAKVLCLDLDETFANGGEGNASCGVSAKNLAYVIYTSGSTGRPKGVAIEHRSTVAFLSWAKNVFSHEELKGVLASTSISFDLSVFEIFLPLSVGTKIILAKDALHLPDLPAANQVTLVNTVPSALAELLRVGGIPESVRAVNLAGEPLQIKLAQQLYQANENVQRIFNLYGPTEDTTYSTFALIRRDFVGTPPIGRPIANTQIYILDSKLQPVPLGVIGELYIGGDGLARGYLNRPELTADKFIADPFIAEPSARLYKTGDLARYRADGDIEFLGRVDHQVKIRGYRIELGEIEAVLGQHPDVRECVVVASEDQRDEKRLVAYLVVKPEQELALGEVGSFLKGKLPEYMVPNAFVMLDAMPLTPNGKVDRRALPAPDQAHLKRENVLVLPRDIVESQLVEIWEDILGAQPIGIRDNFFNLGGHSLLTIRLFAQIDEVFGKNLPIATIFQASTVEKLAERIRQTDNLPNCSTLVPIQPKGSKLPIFCVHASDGHPLRYHSLAQHLGSEQPLYALQSLGMSGEGPLYFNIEEMATHYIREIQTVQPTGPYVLAGLSMGGYVALEMAQQLHAQGQKVGLLALLETDIANVQALSGAKRLQYRTRKWMTRVRYHARNLTTLAPRQKLDYVLNWIKRRIVGDLEPRLAAERQAETIKGLPPHLQEVWKANLLAMRQYVPQEYPGKVVLFKSRDAEGIYYGWRELAKGGVEVHLVPGDHTGVLEEPNVQTLAALLKTCLAQVQATEHYNPHPNQWGRR